MPKYNVALKTGFFSKKCLFIFGQEMVGVKGSNKHMKLIFSIIGNEVRE